MIKEIKIQLAGKEYHVKRTYRSLMEFEEMTGKGINGMQQTLTNAIKLFYCIIKVNNVIDFTFNQFINMIDENESVMDKFNKYIVDSATTVEEPQPVKKKRVKSSK
jgi:hypothetical protein